MLVRMPIASIRPEATVPCNGLCRVVVKLQSQDLKSPYSLHIISPGWTEVIKLLFVTLIKWKQPLKKGLIGQATKRIEELANKGIKMTIYWTLGRYDAVTIIEAPSERDAMKTLFLFQDIVDSETMTAVPREEAIKLL